MTSATNGNGRPSAPPDPAADRTKIYLVRHGETKWSLSGQHTGRTDIPLNEQGEAQARALAPALRSIAFDHVLTSPASRARQTCALAGFADRAEVAPDLAEWDYGDYEGRHSGDIQKSRPGWSVYRDGCPGGESARQVSARADRVIATLQAGLGNVLVFSHAQFACSLAARWVGLAIADAQHLRIDPASIGLLDFNPAHPGIAVIAHWNWTPALLSPPPEARR